MGDNDTSEIEQNEPPKNPSGGALGWYKPPTEPSRVLNEGDDEPQVSDAPHTLTEDETKEQLFRAASIKCAQMEDELVDAVKNRGSAKVGGIFGDSVVSLIEFGDEKFLLYSSAEKLIGVEGGQLGGRVPIEFIENITESYVRKIGMDTSHTLSIGLHTDEETRDEYARLAKQDPRNASNAYTRYYFNSNGDYGKISDIPNSIIISSERQPLFRNDSFGRYESKMTFGDVEIAGRVLKMLKNRVLGITDEAEQQEAQGK